MTDDRVRTRLLTPEGWLDFQDYFVRRQCAPPVREIAFAGAKTAHPHPDFLAALADQNAAHGRDLPVEPVYQHRSDPEPAGVREALRACPAPVVAVSPIIGGKAVKGPTAKMMAELGLPVGAAAVARHYGDLLDHYVIDEADIAAMESLDLPFTATRTLMETLADRDALARVVLAAARGS